MIIISIIKIPDYSQASVVQTIYDIIKSHGGEITVRTKENEGTSFVVKIPL